MKEIKSPFETVESEKIKLGRFTLVQDKVRVKNQIRPYDYLEMIEGVSILPFHGENIITLKEYRYPIRLWQTELQGGLIDPGETAEQAAVRELKEETGLTIDVVKPAYTFTKIRKDYQTVGIGYLASTDDDHVSISFEHTDYKWCPIDELKDYLCDEIYQDIINTLKEYTSI